MNINLLRGMLLLALIGA